jgi:hypothetical protein
VNIRAAATAAEDYTPACRKLVLSCNVRSLVLDFLLVFGLVCLALFQQLFEGVALQERIICCVQLLLLTSCKSGTGILD